MSMIKYFLRSLIAALLFLVNGCVIENTIKGSGGFYTEQQALMENK